jgi:hypothetical protein
MGREMGGGDKTADLTVVLNTIAEDIRHVHVRITATIGIAAVFITQIRLEQLRALPSWAEWLTVGGVVALALSAAAYFQYTQELNKLRLKIVADEIRSHGSSAVSEWGQQFEFKRTWYRRKEPAAWSSKKKRLFWAGQGFLALGSALFLVVLIWLIPLS